MRSQLFLLSLALFLPLSCRSGDKASQGDTAGIGEGDATDADGDGFDASEDCDDQDPSINGGSTEVCDGIDNDCDGETDEDVLSTWYEDQDGDGYGNEGQPVEGCSQPEGTATAATDCDDEDPTIHPAANELCDGVDNDCDDEIDEDGLETWYLDQDGDGWGDEAGMVEDCAWPEGTSHQAGDCDDAEPEAFPGNTEICDEIDNDCDDEVDEGTLLVFYQDADGDGYGVTGVSTEACEAPVGWAEQPDDCDDSDPSYHPGAPETDCTDPNDYNCDGSTGYADDDADGWPACEECNDLDGLVNPDATEICDTIDNDCDGYIDDADSSVDLSTGSTFYEDVDGDGFGDPLADVLACDQPAGHVEDDTDCDDDDWDIKPGATEICDSLDNDCDGLVDDDDPGIDLSTGSTFYEDADGDGYGDAASSYEACEAASGYVTDSTDCLDSEAAVNPGATEVCDTIDNDCDAAIDDADSSVDLSTGGTWYEDGDADGYGDPLAAHEACVQPSGTVLDATDCNDGSASINPGETEICNSIDDDCDSDIDDIDSSLDPSSAQTWYADDDADGYGDPSDPHTSCVQPADYQSNRADCDDTDAAISPAATEICDTIDNDCDSSVDDADSSLDLSTAITWYLDADHDGYAGPSTTRACVQPSWSGSSTSDCNDGSASIHPGASESCNGVDDDCDGTIDDGLTTPSYSTSTASPSGSCNGNANRSVTISVCGCSPVTITGTFSDYSDGSGGQVVGASISSSGMSLTWDDCASGCDCDLDISTSTSWSASKSGTTLTVTVSNQVTGYSAGNSVGAGYSITGYGSYLRSSGSATNSFTYTCSY